jgi:pilus assembly protein Flp/PilA
MLFPQLIGGVMYALLAVLVKDTRGTTAIEYGLVAALIALAAVSVMSSVGHNLSTTFNTVATKL